jgi:hypothetical protein
LGLDEKRINAKGTIDLKVNGEEKTTKKCPDDGGWFVI